jgi:Asp-tRNA(Asn)/Glu-tRNA(Gln) amidotransferase A subunit family amidase
VSDEIWRLDATELAQRIRTRSLSPVEVVAAFLDRMSEVEPAVNAFTVVLDDQALGRARTAEAALFDRRELGPLHGVPIAFKDMTPTQGVVTTLGSPLFADAVPPADSAVVERSKRAGAIVIGKTNMSELTHSAHTTNPLFGTTANPWSPAHSAGGSSGGSAAAVAAGMVPIADATDGGGSIRVPAACCGCYGLKPQFGRIPAALYETKWDPFTTVGPITWTVRDAALLLDIWAGPDDRDPLSLPREEDMYSSRLARDLDGVRVAHTDFGVDTHPTVRSAIDDALATLESLGCRIDSVAIEGFEEAEHAWSTIYWSMFAALYEPYLENDPHLLSEAVREIIQRGRALSARDYHRAETVRSRLYERVAELFTAHDFIATPTLSVPPPLAADIEAGVYASRDRRDPQLGWYLTWPFNLTMHPAASIPVAGTSSLPVGLQIIGRRFSEGDVLRLSASFEAVAPWQQQRPQPTPAEPSSAR